MNNSANKPIKNENFFIFLLTMIQFSHILDFVIMMPLGPQLMRIFEITPSQFSLMVSAYTFSASLFGFFSAFFIDKFDRKNILLFLFAGFILGTFSCAIAPNYTILLIGRIIAGAFGGIIGGLIFSIIGDVVPFSRRGQATGKVMSAFSIASVIGVPLGLAIANRFNWHAPFYSLALFSLILLVLCAIYIPNMTAHLKVKSDKSDLQEILGVITHKNHIWSFLLISILMFSSFSIIPFISPVMVFNAGLLEKDLPYIYLIGGAFTFFSARIVGKLADKFGKVQIFITVATLSTIPIFLLTNIYATSFPIAISITTLFMILTTGRFIPAMAIITACCSTELRGRFMSINSCIQQLASGVASFVAGLMITSGANREIIGYNHVGYLALIAVVLSLFVIKKVKIVDQL